MNGVRVSRHTLIIVNVDLTQALPTFNAFLSLSLKVRG